MEKLRGVESIYNLYINFCPFISMFIETQGIIQIYQQAPVSAIPAIKEGYDLERTPYCSPSDTDTVIYRFN